METRLALFSSVIQIRSNLTTEDSQITSNIIESVSKAKTSEDVHKAFDTYQKERNRLDKLRGETKIPDLNVGECR